MRGLNLIADALVLAGGLIGVLAGGPAAAQNAGCPPFEPPRLEFTLRQTPLRQDFTRSLAQLQQIPGRAKGPAGAEGGQVLGLEVSRIAEETRLTTRLQGLSDGTLCAAVGDLAVTFGPDQSTVYVARELPDGTCIQREVLNHEMKHVAVDEAWLREFTPEVTRRLRAALAELKPVRARTKESAINALRHPVNAMMKALIQDFSAERERRQAKVDTLEEYERVSKSCGGELAKYVKGRGHF